MFCSKCGKQAIPGSAFCESCATEANIPAQQPVYAQTQPWPKSYVVLQVTLKEKFVGTGSKNLSELEGVINAQASRGYRLHTISTASAHSTGMGGGDRIQATLVFESL